MFYSPPPTEWADVLRAQGRSMTWLAQQVGVSRSYLSDIAAGRKQGSIKLLERIAVALMSPPDRLAQVREYADQRAAMREVEVKARALAEAIRIALGEQGGPDGTAVR